MADKLPFDEDTRAEMARAAKTAGAGGIGDSDFWSEFERELSRVSVEHAKQDSLVEPRKVKN